MSIPKNAVNRLAKLPAELSIVDFISHPNADEIIVDIPRPDVVPCPYRVSEHCIIKGHMNRSVRHLAFGSRGTMVTFCHRRYVCRDCRRSFQEPLYWIIDSIRITTALYLSVCRDLQTVSSIRDISLRNGVSEAVTRHILDVTPAYVAPHLPETLCIDEFSGSAGHWDSEHSRWVVSDYHCNLVNGESGCVYDILPSPNKAFLLEYFYALPKEERERVKYFCCDMRSGFLTLAKTVFPNASVCIDTFHVIKLLSDAISETRCTLQRQFRDDGDSEHYSLLKDSARILTTAKANQPVFWTGERAKKNQQRLEDCLALSEELKENYEALQEIICAVHLTKGRLRGMAGRPQIIEI